MGKNHCLQHVFTQYSLLNSEKSLSRKFFSSHLEWTYNICTTVVYLYFGLYYKYVFTRQGTKDSLGFHKNFMKLYQPWSCFTANGKIRDCSVYIATMCGDVGKTLFQLSWWEPQLFQKSHSNTDQQRQCQKATLLKLKWTRYAKVRQLFKPMSHYKLILKFLLLFVVRCLALQAMAIQY